MNNRYLSLTLHALYILDLLAFFIPASVLVPRRISLCIDLIHSRYLSQAIYASLHEPKACLVCHEYSSACNSSQWRLGPVVTTDLLQTSQRFPHTVSSLSCLCYSEKQCIIYLTTVQAECFIH